MKSTILIYSCHVCLYVLADVRVEVEFTFCLTHISVVAFYTFYAIDHI